MASGLVPTNLSRCPTRTRAAALAEPRHSHFIEQTDGCAPLPSFSQGKCPMTVIALSNPVFNVANCLTHLWYRHSTMEYKRCLLRAVGFALSLFANSGQVIASSGQDTWEWHDILEPPLVEADMAECSPTHPVHNVPDFGDGLIASYTFDINDKVGDVKGRIADLTLISRDYNFHETPVRHWALAFPKHLPHGPTEITVDSNLVLTSMDDLLGEYESVCQSSRRPELILRSISYRRASLRERAETPEHRQGPISEMLHQRVPFEPVQITPEPNVTDFLPEAVPGGDFRFSSPGEDVMGKPGVVPLDPPYGWKFDASKIARGAGVHVAALFAGHTFLDSLGRLVEAGFDVMTIEHAGVIETLVIDPTVIDSDEKMRERVRLLVRSGVSVGFYLRGLRMVFFPADAGAVDALRVPPYQKDLLKRHITAVQAQLIAQDLTKLKRPPEETEVEKILSSEWSRFDGAAQGPGYDALFGPPGTTFGGLRRFDLQCEPVVPLLARSVFTCIAGVTFVQDGHPKYQRRSLIFERIRLPGGLQPLKRYDPPVPTPDPAVTQQAQAATLIADGPNIAPTIAEVEQLLKSGWALVPEASLSGETGQFYPPNHGFGEDFAFSQKGTSFGEVHDLVCTERDQVFSCKVGVTFIEESKPTYEQRDITFNRVRGDDGTWELKYYVEPVIVTDTKR